MFHGGFEGEANPVNLGHVWKSPQARVESESSAVTDEEGGITVKKGNAGTGDVGQGLHGRKEEDLGKSPGNWKYSELEESDLDS